MRLKAGLIWGWAALLAAVTARANADDLLMQAARDGDIEGIEMLIGAGVAVDARTQYGRTALSFAADRGHVEAVKTLLELGADPKAVDTFYGATPLTWAVGSGRAEVVAIFLKRAPEGAGAFLNTAVRSGNIPVLEAILEHGDIKPGVLKTALRNAMSRGSDEVVAAFERTGVTLASRPQPRETGDGVEEKALSAERIEALERRAEKVVAEAAAVEIDSANWPQFRGSGATGIADGQHPPVGWDAESGANIRWRFEIPGLGLSSPVIWGDKLFITTAVSSEDAGFRHGLYGDVEPVREKVEHAWKVYALDKKTGDLLWVDTPVTGVPKVMRHTKSTHANSTPATDGEHLVVMFASEGLYCYGLDGELHWKKDLGVLNAGWFYDPGYEWEFASSPIIHGDRIILQCDVQDDPFIAAFSIEDGEELWRTAREGEIPSWSTPAIVPGPAGDELVTNATRLIRGYDPVSGAMLWSLKGNSEVVAPTPVFAEGLVYVTSGYSPIQPIYAIRPGARGDITLEKGSKTNEHIAWSAMRGGPYMPTPLIYEGHLYTCSNNGVLACYDALTGERIYQKRLGHIGGGFSGSPVAADGRLYFPSEDGEVFVVRAGPEYELLATNPLGDVLMASPAISDGMIFVRSLHTLFGIGVRARDISAAQD